MFKKIIALSVLMIGLGFSTCVFAQANSTFNQDAANQLKAAGVTGAGYSAQITSPTTIATSYIKTILALVGTVFLGLTVYGGVLWMTAGGNEDQVEKAKKTITRSIIGLIIITSSYSISLFAERLAKGAVTQKTSGF